MRRTTDIPRTACPHGRAPETAVASDHFLMFRCPDGCDQNTSIDLEHVETGSDGNPVLWIILVCPQCKESYHFKIMCCPYDQHTGHGHTWTQQVEYWRRVRRGAK